MSSSVFKVLGPAATVGCAGFIVVQNSFYRRATKDDVHKLRDEMKQIDGNRRAEIRCVGGNDRIDSLEARVVKLENRVEGLNTKVEKLDLKIETVKMVVGGTGQIASSV